MDFGIVRREAENFDVEGRFISAREYGDGHINDTFLLTYQTAAGPAEYVLQRINKNIFTDSEGLMANMKAITEYIRDLVKREGGDPRREVLTIVPTRDGKTHHVDGEGYCWRTTLLIPDVFSYSVVVDGEQLCETGRAFGHFVKTLDRFDAATLKETIPDFHNTKKRFETFRRAVQEDKWGRKEDASAEIEFAMRYGSFVSTLVDQLESGELPLRVTHNDTKINNVLMDKTTGKAICVVDLDTVMPGLVAYDFGDSIRSGTNPADEDERDLSKVRMDIGLYEAFAKGYLSEAGDILTEKEVLSLPVGAKMITLECGIRFLTDYLEGDHYFKTHRPGQNLDRTRTQFKMVADMDKCWDEMVEITRRYGKK